jgi:hypothetical protein
MPGSSIGTSPAIPVYSVIDDPALLADVTEHVAENHDALRATLLRGHPATSDDLEFIRPHAVLRVRRGVVAPEVRRFVEEDVTGGVVTFETWPTFMSS